MGSQKQNLLDNLYNSYCKDLRSLESMLDNPFIAPVSILLSSIVSICFSILGGCLVAPILGDQSAYQVAQAGRTNYIRRQTS